ncbi:phospholipase domain-containing protein [Actinosynnema sp. NPDC020468]|uniref:phospholipase domain-containing protein n=1 Tax=Actinosynnema sp. NPDC020468 TaxID=3154488 RepID=UPI00340DA5F7
MSPLSRNPAVVAGPPLPASVCRAAEREPGRGGLAELRHVVLLDRADPALHRSLAGCFTRCDTYRGTLDVKAHRYADVATFAGHAAAGSLPAVARVAGDAGEVLDAVARAAWDRTACLVTGEGRAPLVVVSPWSRRQQPAKQVFDDSSLHRFLHRWLGVPHEGPTTSDLTWAFGFGQPYQPDAGARASEHVRLHLRNSGARVRLHLDGEPHDVSTSTELVLPLEIAYRFAVTGPNGFRREFAGTRNEPQVVESSVSGRGKVLTVTLGNSGDTDVVYEVAGDGRRFRMSVRPGGRRVLPWMTAYRHGWYDLAISSGPFHRTLTGHVESG